MGPHELKMFGGERHFFLAVGCGERRRWMTFVPSLTSGELLFLENGIYLLPVFLILRSLYAIHAHE